MTLLSRLRDRYPRIDRTVDGECQTFDAGLWAITLPLDWRLRPGDEPVSIESADRTQCVEISVTALEAGPDAAERLARAMVATFKGDLGRMRGTHWTTLRDDREPVGDGCVAVLDVHDPDRGYRICTKLLVRAPDAIRATFHDYGCTDLARSRRSLRAPLNSLKLRRRMPGAAG